jgi:hypothetical protein
MATAKPFDSKPAAFESSVLDYCLAGIFGTSWGKSATRPKQGADQVLVSPDQSYKQTPHYLRTNLFCKVSINRRNSSST